jgi:muramoyltetrapeptide carboxypeptidase
VPRRGSQREPLRLGDALLDEESHPARVDVLPSHSSGALSHHPVGLGLRLGLDLRLLGEVTPEQGSELRADGSLGGVELYERCLGESREERLGHPLELGGGRSHGWMLSAGGQDLQGTPRPTLTCCRGAGMRSKLTHLPIGKPPRVRRGDVVGVVAPSGAVDEQRLEVGVRVLRGWGLEVELGAAVLSRRAYLAGDDQARRADLDRMIADPRVKAIFCARGGYGSQRVVPLLDWSNLARTPKPIIGYSDATALLNAAVASGVVAVHGPMVATDIARGLTERSTMRLWSVLSDPDLLWEAEVPRVVRPGRASGRLIGGCLSVLATTLGTRYAPDTTGAILFLEEVHERPFRLDRLITHLRQAGMLDHVAAVVFGTLAACPTVDGVGPLDVVRTCLADAPCPVGFGLPAGHTREETACENLALPFGVQVALELDGGSGRLIALEPAVV